MFAIFLKVEECKTTKLNLYVKIVFVIFRFKINREILQIKHLDNTDFNCVMKTVKARMNLSYEIFDGDKLVEFIKN